MPIGENIDDIIQRPYESKDKEDPYGAHIDSLSAQGQTYLYRKNRNQNILNEAADLAEKLNETFNSLDSDRDEIKPARSYFSSRPNSGSTMKGLGDHLSVNDGNAPGTGGGLGSDRLMNPKGHIDALSKGNTERISSNWANKWCNGNLC